MINITQIKIVLFGYTFVGLMTFILFIGINW